MFAARMKRHDAQWWSERVAEFEQTKDAEEVAQRYGVRAKTLLWWRTELRKRARSSSGSDPVRRNSARLLPVVVRAQTTSSATEAAELVVENRDVRMTMRGATPEHLEAIVTAMTRGC